MHKCDERLKNKKFRSILGCARKRRLVDCKHQLLFEYFASFYRVCFAYTGMHGIRKKTPKTIKARHIEERERRKPGTPTDRQSSRDVFIMTIVK